MQIRLLTGFLLWVFVASARAEHPSINLTDEEKRQGWRLLFDGHSTQNWMTIKGAAVPEQHVQDGALNLGSLPP
jgi:hypothetical protein